MIKLTRPWADRIAKLSQTSHSKTSSIQQDLCFSRTSICYRYSFMRISLVFLSCYN